MVLDWSISINYENRRLIVNAGRVIQPQLLFVQLLSLDHVLQKLQYVDKSIYVGARPLQFIAYDHRYWPTHADTTFRIFEVIKCTPMMKMIVQMMF